MRILIIEDDSDHIELEQKICRDAFGVDTRVKHAPDLVEGLELLTTQPYDVCLCDLEFPGSNTEQTVARLQATRGEALAPIVVLTSHADEESAVDLLHHGIQDFILKSELSAAYLHRVVTFAIQRKSYQQLLEERNRDQQAFCSSLSHDFRGKIGNIKMTSEILQQDLKKHQPLSERQQQWFGFIDDSSAHMLTLVEGLTTYLRVDQDSKDFEDVPLLALIEQLTGTLTVEQNLQPDTISVECDANIVVPGDPTQLYLMLQNLVKNAVKFSPPDPKVAIAVQHKPDQETVEISVRDWGVGLDPRDLQRIFEPFHRAHENIEGTGLGLSIVNRVVQRHNGLVSVESEPGEGSVFSVTLPDRSAKAA